MFDTISIIQTVGLIGIFLIIFLESGVFFGFFLPGDSLLFTAGVFAAAGYLPIGTLLVGCVIAAILGDSVGYFTGKYFGIRLFTKEDNIFFKKKYLVMAEKFYEKHGAKTIFFARFIPFIRTFAPIVAGIGNMKYRKFVTYNILGAVIWPFVMFSIGYFIGSRIPNVEKYLPYIVVLIIIISLLPVLIQFIISRYKKSSI